MAIRILQEHTKMSLVAGKKLNPSQRYTFYYKNDYVFYGRHMFRANFIDVINNTLQVNRACEMYPNSMTTIPLYWIEKVETIVDVVDESNSVLPEDVLLIIDSYQ